ncbi:hypothetical protein J6S88_05745 [bacterium]|nr:hypothetical protein [bacterium]
MKVLPVLKFSNISFKSDKNAEKINVEHVNPPAKPLKQSNMAYDDPLLNWPIRGLAFTNDIGAAIMDLAPVLGKLLWVPALMYFGADIYDKYKTDEREYSPSAHRGLKQAIFQACASVICPIIVVHNGQKIASQIGKLNNNKNNLSLQLREEIDTYTVNMLKRRSLKKYENNIEGFKDEYNRFLSRHLNDYSKSTKTKNPFRIIFRLIFGSKHRENIPENTLRNTLEYADKNIDEIFKIREDLLNNVKPESFSNKQMKNFQKTKAAFSRDTNTIEGYLEDAVKDALKHNQKKKIYNTKLRKTLGGFVALALTIKFIDTFVEKHIIDAVVEPKLENFSNKKTMAQFAHEKQTI